MQLVNNNNSKPVQERLKVKKNLTILYKFTKISDLRLKMSVDLLEELSGYNGSDLELEKAKGNNKPQNFWKKLYKN